jgi:hypothetical protein
MDGKFPVCRGELLRFQNTAQQRNDIKGPKMQEGGNFVM